jgi:hypothetical protein
MDFDTVSKKNGICSFMHPKVQVPLWHVNYNSVKSIKEQSLFQKLVFPYEGKIRFWMLKKVNFMKMYITVDSTQNLEPIGSKIIILSHTF